jgi:hypothetical protein
MPRVGIEEGALSYNSAQLALQSFHSQGFRLPQDPGTQNPQAYNGTLPHGLENFDNSHLASLLHQVSGWLGWVSGVLTTERGGLADSTEKLEFIKGGLRLAVQEANEKKMSAQDKDDIIGADPRTHAASAEVRYYSRRVDLLKMLYDNGQRDWETVSRTITVRGQELERTRRGENVGNIPISHPATFRRP